MTELKFELSPAETEYLEKIHNARALREMMSHPGWEIYQKVVQNMMGRLEDQHLSFAAKASRDAYWASGLRLGAAREFATMLIERLQQSISILEQPLQMPKGIEEADLDGYIHRNGSKPEGDE